MPSRLVVGAAAVVDEDGVRDDGRRRHAVVALEDRLDAVGRPAPRGPCAGPGSERACVSLPMKSGPSIPCARAVVADRLGDGQDVRLGEGAVAGTCPDGRWCRRRRAGAGRRGRADWRDRRARVRIRRSKRSRARVDLPRDDGHRRCSCQFHRTRFGAPDLAGVLRDRAIARELAGMRHVEDRPARPFIGLEVERADLVLGLRRRPSGRPGACSGRRGAAAYRQIGAKIPGSSRLKSLEAIMSRARRVSGSCS